MRPASKYVLGLAAAASSVLLPAGSASAETAQFCVKCTDPDQTYLCNVDTPHANPSRQGLQLYCIVRTSKDGGHGSCAVDAGSTADCAGEVRTYTFQAPEIPDDVRNALNRYRGSHEPTAPVESVTPPDDGQPRTLIDLTRRSVGASKEGLKNAGEAVGNATGTTTDAARGVGRGVARTAGKVGSATKKTGSAVGSAAKTAWDCMKSLFKDCSSSDTE